MNGVAARRRAVPRSRQVVCTMLLVLATLGLGLPASASAEPEKVTFTTKPPENAVIGESAKVVAEAPSHVEVTITAAGPACEAQGVVKAPKAEATIVFQQEGTCTVEAAAEAPVEKAIATVQVTKKPQVITFTSSAPKPGVVGTTYAPTAQGGASNEPVILTRDPTSGSACSFSEGTFKFETPGTCVIDANQAGTAEFAAAPQVQQTVEVKRPQAIEFTSIPPTPALVGGTYTVSANGGGSGNPVEFTVDPSSAGVCTIAGSVASFVGTGTCTINADQKGDATYVPAHEHQSFAVSPAPTPITVVPGPSPPSPTPSPTPTPSSGNSNFKAGLSTFEAKTGRVIFYETIVDPGTFTWLLTVPNGKFGVFASSKKCNVGLVRLSGRCRPARVIFATGTASVPAGVVIFKLRPAPNALSALKNALKQNRGLLVTARFTFQSARGGAPVTHTQTLRVKLKR
jgi:hypothetical protein